MADPAGPLVKWEDYKRLDDLCKQLMKQHSDISCENIRLRKAGDAMAFNYEQMHNIDGVYDSDLMKFVARWNAAKEGKPTE